MPMLACLALDIWVEEPDCVRALTAALPGLDVSILRKIEALRDEPESVTEAEEVRALLREAFVLIESIHDRLLVEIGAGDSLECST